MPGPPPTTLDDLKDLLEGVATMLQVVDGRLETVVELLEDEDESGD